MAKYVPLPDIRIEPGQQWRRKSNGTVIQVVEERVDTHFLDATDDWKVRKLATGRTGWIFGFNLKRLYDLVPVEERVES